MHRIVSILFVGLMVVFVTGCQTLYKAMTPEGSLFGAGRVNIASANQMVYEEFEGFTDEQLRRMLDPSDSSKSLEAALFYANYNMQPVGTKDQDQSNWQTNSAFSHARRSQIQDRLIAASDQRCNVYATHLKKMSSTINGFFGITTTALAGAGAIVTGAEAARLLAGLAGISSGSRAELNQALFETVTTSIIIPAFKKQRKEIYDEIMAKRNGEKKIEMDVYTVEAAIADAIRYHGACSLDAGIAYAQKSITHFDDVGIKKALEIKKILEETNSPSRTIDTAPKPGTIESGNKNSSNKSNLNNEMPTARSKFSDDCLKKAITAWMDNHGQGQSETARRENTLGQWLTNNQLTNTTLVEFKNFEKLSEARQKFVTDNNIQLDASCNSTIR